MRVSDILVPVRVTEKAVVPSNDRLPQKHPMLELREAPEVAPVPETRGEGVTDTLVATRATAGCFADPRLPGRVLCR